MPPALRRALPLCLLPLAACASSPPPELPEPRAEIVAEGPPAAPLAPCPALQKPLHSLRELAGLVALGRSMPIVPRAPEPFVAELSAEAVQAAAVKTDDPALAKLASDTAVRLTMIAAASRALTASRGPDQADAARTTLLEEMERGEILVHEGAARCATGDALLGRLSAAGLARVVRGGAGAFQACYEPALRRDPTLRGTVRVRFVVARDGSVSDASDVGQGPPDPLAWGRAGGEVAMRDQAVSACVVAAFKRLAFPKPEGGTFEATLPIELGRR